MNEYTQFVEKVRYYEAIDDDSPIQSAIDWCVRNHILEEFLKERESEVLKAMALDYTFERQLELTRRDTLEEGRQEGLKEGLREGRYSVISNMLLSGKTSEEIAAFCNIPLDEVIDVEKKMKK